jgi:glycine/D-amino acid oxidase-like deaminating enzyme
MSEDIFAPEFKTTPLWWDAVSPSTDYDAQPPETTEVAIVGSGYSGLSAALELARSGTSVTVLEQNDIGWGASTRNGGMLSGEPKFASDGELERRFGKQTTERILEDGRATFPNLVEIVEREGIDCHLQRNGRFIGAHSPKAFRELEAKARHLEADGITGFELVPRERQKEYTDTDYYHGGLFEADGGCLHPALYHRGILDACIRHGVTLCGNTRVEGIERTGDGFRVATTKGIVSAKEVVVGTNGYTSAVTPWQRRRLIPLGSYIIATEEIGEERVDSMFRNFCTMSNTQRILFYYRPSHDHKRVVFGGRARFSATTERDSSPRLYEYMCGVFPQLRGVKITHGWMGNVAFTFDGLPHMGTHEGVHFCMGCNGSGVQMMSFLGRQIALKILGRTNRPCGFDEIPFETRPLYTGNPWFLPIVGNYYRLRDRIDRAMS